MFNLQKLKNHLKGKKKTKNISDKFIAIYFSRSTINYDIENIMLIQIIKTINMYYKYNFIFILIYRL